MDKLLPCPFCEGKTELIVRPHTGIPSGDAGYLATIQCLSGAEIGCFAKMSHWSLKKQRAIDSVTEAWNRRAQQDNKLLTKKQYETIIDDLQFHGGCYVCVHFDKDKPIGEQCKIGGCDGERWTYRNMEDMPDLR